MFEAALLIYTKNINMSCRIKRKGNKKSKRTKEWKVINDDDPIASTTIC